MKRLCILMLFISLVISGFTQEVEVKPDTMKGTINMGTTSLQTDSGKFSLKLPRLNPTTDLQPQFTPYQRFTINRPSKATDALFPPIFWSGAASDFINSKSSTAIAIMTPAPNLLLHSSVTLGLVETPWLGKGTYFMLDAGANYAISPVMNLGISGGYNSNFGTLPFWNAGIDASYMLHPNLMIDGGINYLQTGQNRIGINQSALMIDLHGRYRLNDDWYLNAYGGMPVMQNNKQPQRSMLPMMNTPYYGGSVEYWFNATTGVEGGMIWQRDMFTGKMRPQPKLELLFRPGR